MEILVVGAGKVGRSITKELCEEGHDITLIDTKSSVLEDVQTKYDVITYNGNGASKTSLEEADIENKDVFIAVTNADEINLLSCLTARALNPNIHTIARIRTPEYVQQAVEMSETFGLSLVINPERQAAQEIARLLKYPGFLKRDSFAKARCEMVSLKINEHHNLDGVYLKDLSSQIKAKILITIVERNNQVYMPSGDFKLMNGDIVYITGEQQQLHKMLKNINAITKPVKHVVVAGGSKISYYLAQELEKSKITTTIIERDHDKCEELAEHLPNTTIIESDVSNDSVFENEDIMDYDAFVSMTGLDELNIVTSMYANSIGIPNVVTKLGRGMNSSLVDNLSLGSVVCPKALITMHIVRYVRAIQDKEGAALTIHKLVDGQVEVIEFVVDEKTKHIGENLKDVNIRKNVLVTSINSGMKSEIASGDSSFDIGDTVIVVAPSELRVHYLNDIFEA